jgi:hypothetical protein
MLCKTVLPMLHPSPYLLLILINLTATKSEAEAWVAIQTNVSISFTSETHSKKHYLGARARALFSAALWQKIRRRGQKTTRGTTKRRTMRADNKNKVPRGHRIVSCCSRIYSARRCPWHCVYFIIRTRTCFSSSISGGIAVIITALHAQNALNEFIHSPRK